MEKGSSSSSSSSSAALIGGGGLKWLLPEEGPSPAKKGRAGAAQGSQPPRCQVEECEVDLSDAKAYYCRHKVCGMHSKSPKVIVAGLEQRFCQQCSRSPFFLFLFIIVYLINYKHDVTRIKIHKL